MSSRGQMRFSQLRATAAQLLSQAKLPSLATLFNMIHEEFQRVYNVLDDIVNGEVTIYGGGGGGGGGAGAGQLVNEITVPVASADWTSDSALYPNAPNHGTLYYADVNHGLGAGAWATRYEIDDFIYTDITFQKPGAENNRIWMYAQPGVDIDVYVQVLQ